MVEPNQVADGNRSTEMVSGVCHMSGVCSCDSNDATRTMEGNHVGHVRPWAQKDCWFKFKHYHLQKHAHNCCCTPHKVVCYTPRTQLVSSELHNAHGKRMMAGSLQVCQMLPPVHMLCGMWMQCCCKGHVNAVMFELMVNVGRWSL